MIYFIVFLLLVTLIYVHFENKKAIKEINRLTSDVKELAIENRSIIPFHKYENEINNLNDELLVEAAERFKIQEKYDKLFSKQKSEQVRLGQISEKLLPFLEEFPYKTDDIAALFMPIDLIVFSESEIVFVEIKTGNAVLSDKQRQIKKLIDNKQVRFETHRLNNGQYLIDDKKAS